MWLACTTLEGTVVSGSVTNGSPAQMCDLACGGGQRKNWLKKNFFNCTRHFSHMLFCFTLTSPFEEVIILIFWRGNWWIMMRCWDVEIFRDVEWLWLVAESGFKLRPNFENWVISAIFSYLQASGHDGEHRGGTGLHVEYEVGVNGYVLDPI